jgi:hypothetical protein
VHAHKLFFLVIEKAVTIALEIGILDLCAEFLAHALVLGGACQTAGAIAARAGKSFSDGLYHFLIGILSDFHNICPHLLDFLLEIGYNKEK